MQTDVRNLPTTGPLEVGRERATAAAGPKLQTAFGALTHRNFQLFFAGQLVSLTGTWMQSVAQSWLVYRLTGSAVLLGAVAFAGQLPGFLFAPVGGAVADKSSRRSILVATQISAMLLAAVLALLTLSGAVAVWHVFALAALGGVVNAFDFPARQAFVIDMVGREDLMNAIALNSTAVNGARLVGPAMAGLLVAAVGEGWCFSFNAVSYIPVVIGLSLMRVSFAKRAVAASAPALASILEGFRFVGRTSPIRALMILLGLLSLLGLPYTVLMPVFADRVFGAGPGGLGMLMGAAGTGALLGALVLVARRGVRGMGRWVAFSSAGFGAGLIAFSWARPLWLACLVLVPVGFAMMIQIASSNTLIQAMVPDNLRGRVMAVYSMMFLGAAPLGAMLAGVLAGQLGAPLTVTLGGAGCIAAAVVFTLRLPALRREARRLSDGGEGARA
jgi:MFS family permease